MRFYVLFLFLPVCVAQSSGGTDLPHDLTGGFRYEVRLGQNSYFLNNSPGYAIKYSYRPRRWLALEAGVEQIPRPIGSSVCCQYISTAADQLFLVPFGGRFVRESGRARISLGGGGAYLDHKIGNPLPSGGLTGASGFGGQVVGGVDYGLTASGRFRVGITARYYYVPVGSERTARILTIGPDFTFSFR